MSQDEREAQKHYNDAYKLRADAANLLDRAAHELRRENRGEAPRGTFKTYLQTANNMLERAAWHDSQRTRCLGGQP